jgi:hypothetical protein
VKARSNIWAGLPRLVLYLALSTGLFAGLTGCSNERRLAKGKPLKSQPASDVLDQYHAAQPGWQWLGMKLEVTVVTDVAADDLGRSDGANRETQSFKATARIARDSVIWLSISPALGVEVARLMLTQDSVFLMSKVPGDRFFYNGTYEAIELWAQTPLDFTDIQALLTGQSMRLNPEEDRFSCRVEGDQYVLVSKYKRSVKRITGLKDRALQPGDSIVVQLPDRRFDRLRERAGEDELLVKRHWFDGLTFDPVRDVFDDLYAQRFLTIDRARFEMLDQERMARKIEMRVEAPEGSIVVSIDVSRARAGREYDFPFQVPESMERRDAW